MGKLRPLRLFPPAILAALVFGLILASARGVTPAAEPTVEELKAKLASSGVADKPRICVQIAEKQLAQADKLYAAAEDDKGQASLTDVVAYSELARDYAIQSHHHEKQTEIAVRGMARKLADMMRALPHDEQAVVKDAIKRLEHVRDDLLMAMFPKGMK